MNQQFSTLKKAVEVFHTYGITLAGPRKNDHLVAVIADTRTTAAVAPEAISNRRPR